MQVVFDHIPVMYRYALKLTKDPDKAHDVVVDTIFRLSKVDLSNIEYVKSYMNGAVKWAFISSFRKSKYSYCEIDPEEHSVDPDQELTVQQRHIYELMGPVLRDIYFKGKNVEEISKDLKISRTRANAIFLYELKEFKRKIGA